MPKTANGHGSNGKIDPVVVEKICAALRTGVTLESAAAAAGIGRQTLYDWLRRGRQPRAAKAYRDLIDGVDQSLATFETQAMARIERAGAKEWQADAWRLERRHPEKYGRRTRIDGNVQVQAVPFIDASKLTVQERGTLIELLKKASPTLEQLPAEGRPALELIAGEGGNDR